MNSIVTVILSFLVPISIQHAHVVHHQSIPLPDHKLARIQCQHLIINPWLFKSNRLESQQHDQHARVHFGSPRIPVMTRLMGARILYQFPPHVPILGFGPVARGNKHHGPCDTPDRRRPHLPRGRVGAETLT
ncbi:hypothetical protein BCR44DRAFT_39917 [Catenaria anguillulae PL171]|uniref:Secreted protein n=1 Tax=Catenaria anguillulae PL171 TaxID=765915 RepID=A0A1Y2H503_9FUNG|nr:hypothetical protein BCR44DRAFT_1448866 [Catenaria anguillulae PL171]ORZ32550.1 hypothetical protein BCR44DRAFT_39917 [Catenaria anguillulae PL171]